MASLNLFLPLAVVEQSVQVPSAGLGENATAVAPNITILGLIGSAGPVVKLVLLLLVLMSVVTWGIMFTKWLHFRRARKDSEKFSNVFWGSRNLAQINEVSQTLKNSPVAAVYAAGHRELTQLVRSGDQKGDGDFGDVENIDRALKRAKAEEVTQLEQGTTFLATTASAAPFIGWDPLESTCRHASLSIL